MIQQYITAIALVITDVAVIFGAIAAINKSKKDMHDKLEKVAEGIKCMHRSEMLKTYYRNVDNKSIKQYEFEDFLLHYASYKVLGGNSFIDKIHKEVSEWEISA